MPAKNLLLTGRPGCGKTTVVKRLIAQLPDISLAGFYTQEIREKGERVGFEAIGLKGSRSLLAHIRSSSSIRVGRYGIEVGQFEKLLKQELDASLPALSAFIIDEIGKMECYSQRFVATVRKLLDSPTPVLATVALRGSGFPAEVKARRDVEIETVDSANREELPVRLAKWVRELGAK